MAGGVGASQMTEAIVVLIVFGVLLAKEATPVTGLDQFVWRTSKKRDLSVMPMAKLGNRQHTHTHT